MPAAVGSTANDVAWVAAVVFDLEAAELVEATVPGVDVDHKAVLGDSDAELPFGHRVHSSSMVARSEVASSTPWPPGTAGTLPLRMSTS